MPDAPSRRALLAVDVGTVSGWAFGLFSAVQPDYGRWVLPKKDALDAVGARVAALEDLLIPFLDEREPSHVVMVEPFMSRNARDAESSLALRGIVRSEVRRRSLSYQEMPEGTVRKEMLGRGGGSSSEMKALVMSWCERHGLAVQDHNVGDACVLWRWSRDEMVRQGASSLLRRGR